MDVFTSRPRALHPAERVAEYRARGWWTDETIDDLLRHQVARRPDRLAVVDPPDKPGLMTLAANRWTWAELDSAVDHVAATLLGSGIRPGDLIGVQLPNSTELVATYLAAIRIGAVVSPLPVPYREYEIGMLAGLAGFRAFITADRIGERNAAETAVAVLEPVPSVGLLFSFGDNPPPGTRRLDVAAADFSDRATVGDHLKHHRPDPNDCVTVCWTSGTESTPKAVPRCHYDWIAISWPTVDGPQLTGDDVILNPFPMVNMASVAGTMLPWLRLGCTYVLHHPFTLPEFLRQIAAERVTYTLAPPAILTLLLQNESLMAAADLSSLRCIASGSAPLAPSMVRGWQEDHGISVVNFFGSNEGICLLGAPADFPDPEIRAQYFPRYGLKGESWSGRTAERVSLRLVDLVTGVEITEPGRPGELYLKGPMVFAGYLEGTTDADPFDDQGYLRTGDVFEIAGERGQYLHYVDRSKDLIIRGGMNIAPAEIEGLLASHPGVAEVAVVGYPDPVLGQRACAVVVVRPGVSLDADQLLGHLRGLRIASYKLPERFVFVPELPRNPMGKIVKPRLRELLAAGRLDTSPSGVVPDAG
ncbi:class I adenylate-forming enzyme family protein [Streptomyces sp. 3214.6]|uniref:class I adenylate-forming enzyme family protein n=1 Tax=Streptomyces sp. 3214.6 TaxID=1882757 RepID=UPI00090B1C57|nr:class I adenylate-forming enzyme family protein [Streptomyces sp. 3214.6]SHI26115.1 Acyl-CoA synthetase (AMP-forming)/AMP-acid ligase II [Streptomyces sp. 3214.6]